MLILFQVCFGVGLGYALISFLLGHLFEMFDLTPDGDVDTPFDASWSADTDLDGDFGGSVSPFKPSVIAVFLVVFGGLGMLLLRSFSIFFVISAAAVTGLAAAFTIYRFVYIALYRAQNTSAVEMQSLIGQNAKVGEYIPQGKYGKITYYVNGNTYNAPARSEDGAEIMRGANVEIVSIVKNTFFVKKQEF